MYERPPLLVIVPLVTLVVTMLFFYLTRKALKQYSTYFYIGAAAILLFFVGIDFTPYKAMIQKHSIETKFLYDLFKRGGYGGIHIPDRYACGGYAD